MKVLINNDFKALRAGEFVTANEEAGEFIFDSNDIEVFSLATLMEIAKKNGGKIAKAKKEIFIENLTNHLETLELPQMTEISDSQKVAEIVAAGVEAGKDDEDMLIEIVQSGVKFKQAGKLFAQAMQAGGYRITSKMRKEKCRQILVDAEFSPESFDDLQKMIQHLTEEVDDTVTSQAYSIIRSYAKEFEVELPKPPKKSKGSLVTRATDWMVENPTCDKDDLAAWIEAQGKDDPEGKLLLKLGTLLEFGQNMARAIAS